MAEVEALVARADRLEKDTAELFQKVNDTRETQAGINEKLAAMLTTLGEVKEAVSKLQSVPGNRWNALINVVIAAIAGGLVGFFIK